MTKQQIENLRGRYNTVFEEYSFSDPGSEEARALLTELTSLAKVITMAEDSYIDQKLKINNVGLERMKTVGNLAQGIGSLAIDGARLGLDKVRLDQTDRHFRQATIFSETGSYDTSPARVVELFEKLDKK